MADVIEIDQLRLERRLNKVCLHKRLSYDPHNEYIECQDCGLPVQPFKAFMILVNNYNSAIATLQTREKDLQALEERCGRNLLIATRRVDQAWRSKGMAPTCPHCNEAILPEDGFGAHTVNKKIALERRKFKQKG